MIYPAFGCLLVALALLALRDIRGDAERQRLQEGFAKERLLWMRERRDLNNRIQVPESAPYLVEDDVEAGRDDLPTLPEFAINEDELAKAKAELAAAGYEEGPVV